MDCSCFWAQVKSGYTIVIVGSMVEKAFTLKGLDVALRWRVNLDKYLMSSSLSLTLYISILYLYCLINFEFKTVLKGNFFI